MLSSVSFVNLRWPVGSVGGADFGRLGTTAFGLALGGMILKKDDENKDYEHTV